VEQTVRDRTEYQSEEGYKGSSAAVCTASLGSALPRRSGFAAEGLLRNPRGFTLIEVVVATAILFISVLTLMVSYYGYYGRIQRLRISTIGDNLAQLQMEDVLSKSKAQLRELCRGNDILDENYCNKPLTYPPSWADQQPPVVFDHASADPNVYDTGGPTTSKEHDEGVPVEGTFYVRRVSSIDGHVPTAFGDVPDNLYLPAGIVSVETVSKVGGYEYNVLLHKSVFPGYQKRIRIEDTTPSDAVPVEYHVFLIEVTVYWTIGGRTQSRVLRTEK
jgi:prepilin-type N-terminal cleavage/methylation domain-containing protein